MKRNLNEQMTRMKKMMGIQEQSVGDYMSKIGNAALHPVDTYNKVKNNPNGAKNFVKGFGNAIMGSTGNKFWDALKNSELYLTMKDGSNPNEKTFCSDEECYDKLVVSSDGSYHEVNGAAFKAGRTDTPPMTLQGKIVLNTDGSFVFKDSTGKTSNVIKSK